MSITNNILNNLNEPQIEAVTTINGPLQVIAGAGSGKTRVLVHRIAYLIEQGVKPWNILALTFTNKAAKEMKMRISQLVDPDDANKIWAGTFHSVFARILRTEAQYLGYSSNFTIYDEDDAVRIVKKIQDGINISQKQYAAKAIYSVISTAKNKLMDSSQYAKSASSPAEKVISEIYRLYQDHSLQNNAMDFDDLLCNMVQLLENQDILEKYQHRFKYILVDEYQDTNHVQYKAVSRLAAHHQNLCIVGDDAQSIYKWRGADIQNILDFAKDYPYCKTIKLEQNYRSTQNILTAADSLIQYNKNQLPKKLWTNNEIGDKVKVLKLNDEKMEAATILSLIKKQLAAGENLNDFAVLYRTNAQSLMFENVCRQNNISYSVVGGMSFYRRKEIKDTLAYLRVLTNPQDSNSLMRIINEPPRGIGTSTVESLIEYANMNKISLFSALSSSENIINRPKLNATICRLVDTFNKYSKLAKTPDDTSYLFDYIQDTGIIDFYKEIDNEESRDRLANIEQLLNDITTYIGESPDRTLDSYIEQAALISDLDTKDFDENKLTLMTLHSAKGLEFNHVFIPGMEDNLFPLFRDNSPDKDIEEERRLFYVGITRARKTLYLTYAARRLRFGKIFQNKHSSFLAEIDKDVLTDVYANTFLTTKAAYPLANRSAATKKEFPAYNDIPRNENYSQIPYYEQSATSNAYRVGDIVKHASFGVGKILGIAGVADSQKVTVHFNAVGRKQLLLQYAKLEKMNNY